MIESGMATEWNTETIVEMVEIIKCVFNDHQNKLIDNITIRFFLKGKTS